jgi:DNA replicative helicase MCM subunit Mcm2 (Cdc46/Mcm family)
MSTHKSFDVALVHGPGSKTKPAAVGDLTADQIGSLVVVKAIVTRASEVRP